MTTTPGPAEKRTLAVLDRLAAGDTVRARLDASVKRLEARLLEQPGAQMSWEVLPLSLFGPGLPKAIRSAWVFMLRAGARTGAERHPNSHQRTLSYRGEGNLRTREDGRWKNHRLVSDRRAPRRVARWVSIPPDTWHEVVVPGAHWVVVSFHTALADELIEERPRQDAPRANERRLYAGDSAR